MLTSQWIDGQLEAKQTHTHSVQISSLSSDLLSISAGYPDPEVVWLCGTEPVMESPTVHIEYEEDGRCTLVLAKVGPDDSNVYTCQATNDHGEVSCLAKLMVKK